MGQMSIDHSSKVHQADLQKHSVLIDTDIGDDIDDALALALALRSPEIELHVLLPLDYKHHCNRVIDLLEYHRPPFSTIARHHLRSFLLQAQN